MSGSDDELVVRAQARLGTVLRGKYRLDRVLGIGGMATVYAATHRNGNEFAVKMLHPDLSMRTDIRNRFLREGHAAGSVKHPGAVQVIDDDVAEDGSAFLVMELLRGDSIELLWERQHQRFPLKLVMGIGIQLLDVLQAAHDRGVIHRDIKPANIFLTHTGHVKVLDFGIARIRDMTASQATQTGTMIGTPAFMPPEQAMAKTSEIDAQTDVWAVGATLFTLASGRLVHEADNAQQIMIRAATTPAPHFGSVVPEAPPMMAEVIDRALAFEKAGRWSNAAAMREALSVSARSIFGSVPNADMLVNIIAELGEEATVVQQHPRMPPGAAVSPTDEVTAQVRAKDASRPSHEPQLPATPPFRGAPIAELATAQPVSTDASRRPLERSRMRSPLGRAVFSGAILAVVGILATVVFVLQKSSVPPSPALSSSAQSASPERTPLANPSSGEGAAPALAPAAPTGSVQEVQIDDLPSAPATNKTPAATATSRSNPASTAPKSNCTPPYTFDAQGNRKWKRECLR